MAIEENQQEILFKFNMFEKQISELQQQISAVERGIVELNTLNYGLDDLIGKKESEIFAPLGKGIFVKAKLISEELTVDIGQGNFIQKSIPETKALILEQIKKLNGIKRELEENINNLEEELRSMIIQIEERNSYKSHSEEDCNCEKNECNEEYNYN